VTPRGLTSQVERVTIVDAFTKRKDILVPFTPQFSKAEDIPTGKRAECVAGMLKLLIDAEGEPIPWGDMCDEVGMEHHGQLMPAMHALELAGVVERFTYVEPDATRSKPAFALASNVEVAD
jgi:hypothetical protein